MNIQYFEPAFAAPVSGRLAAFSPSLATAGLVLSLLLPACTTVTAPPLAVQPNRTLSAIGYGTVEKSDKYSRSQIKLMAMRASKMDAYRSLAEQLNGMQLRGQTKVDDMEVTYDSYQVFLNAYLRGARVKRTSPIGSDIYAGDDMFETVVELDLTPRFYECINGSSALLNQCLQQNAQSPTPNVEQSASAAPGFDHSAAKVASISTAACNTADCYNYPATKGFNRK